MPFDVNIDAQLEVYICSCCSNCFPMTKKVSMNLLHENCHHSDFGPSFMGLYPGACGLGNLCVNKECEANERLCSPASTPGLCPEVLHVKKLNGPISSLSPESTSRTRIIPLDIARGLKQYHP